MIQERRKPVWGADEDMCAHEFDIMFYASGILIRKCQICGKVELMTESWVKVKAVASAIRVVNEMRY